MSKDTPCIAVCMIDPRTSLCFGCGRTLPEIARWHRMDSAERQAVMAELAARMEAAGLVSRHPHELDRRAHRVRLQSPGRRSFEKAKKIAIELQEQVLTALPIARRTRFLEELETIADACGGAAER